MKINKILKKYSLQIILTLFIISFSFFMMNFFIKDVDYYWHIKAGEYMARHHTILTHDVFSWYLGNKYWMSHEWLFEVILYKLNLIFPKMHIYVYIFFNLLLLNLLLYFTNYKKYMKNILFSLLWICFSLILYGMLQARPHMISYILLSLTVYVLYDLYNNEDSKKVFLLPLIALIWSNVHGGSSNLSYLIPLIFLFCGMFKFNFEKIESKKLTNKQIIKYLVVIILSVLFICINPHGIKMLYYPYQNMQNKIMLNNISEWQPTNLNITNHYVYFVLVLFILAIIVISKRKIKFVDFMLFLFVLFLGLKSIRFWGYTYIVMTYIIFNYVEKVKPDKNLYRYMLILILFLICLSIYTSRNTDNKLNSKILDDDVINVIKKVKPKRLYNFYDYGGYLIYNNIKVFIDGRADLYSDYNYSDYLNICNLNGDFEYLIDKYNFDYFLVSDQFRINNYLMHNTKYRKIIVRGHAILYMKKDV